MAGRRARRGLWLVWGGRALVAAVGLVAVAGVDLARALVSGEWALAYVADYTSRDTPWPYRLAGLWAGMEGSLLLWTLFVGVAGAAAARWSRRRLPALEGGVVGGVAALVAVLVALLLWAAPPFARLEIPAIDGAGLTPVLRHPAMLYHPLLLYGGQVALLAPFAIAVAARWRRLPAGAWLVGARRAMALALALLGVAMVAGAHWAYVELGWGGYWAWDPVENTALLPWLAGVAFLHVARRGAARAAAGWACAAFLLGLGGAFLTRSGATASVHAFAEAAVVGWVFAGLLAAATALAVGAEVRARNGAGVGGAMIAIAERPGAVGAGEAGSAARAPVGSGGSAGSPGGAAGGGAAGWAGASGRAVGVRAIGVGAAGGGAAGLPGAAGGGAAGTAGTAGASGGAVGVRAIGVGAAAGGAARRGGSEPADPGEWAAGEAPVRPLSRERALAAGAVVLGGLVAVVVVGTAAPLVRDGVVVTGRYYALVAWPFALLVLALSGAGPRLRWGGVRPAEALRRLAPGLAAAPAGALAAAALLDAPAPFAVAVAGLGAMSAALTAAELVARWRGAASAAASAAALLAHLGVAVLLVGVAGTTTGTQRGGVLGPGQEMAVRGYVLTLDGIEEADAAGPGAAVRAAVGVERGGRRIATLRPVAMLSGAGQRVSVAGLRSTPAEDLQVTLRAIGAEGTSAVVDVTVLPLMQWVWWGGLLVAGAVAAAGRGARSVAVGPG